MNRTRPPGMRPYGARATAGGYGSPIIPRVTPGSFSTNRFIWLAEEAWEDGQKARFIALRAAPALGLYAPMPALPSRRSEAPELIGRWLLCDSKGDTARATVEVQGARAGFSTLLALVSSVDGPGGWTASSSREALSFLISALIILTEADLIKLAPLSVACGQELTQLGFGTEQQVWTPLSSLARLASAEGGRSLPVVHIDALSWWELEAAGRDRQALAYLEKRIQIADELARPAPPPPRGVLARLARLLSGRR